MASTEHTVGFEPADRLAQDRESVRRRFWIKFKQVVAKLPAELRIVVILRYTEQLSYDEIAEILGCPSGTVASRLNRAHKLLERRLAGLRNTLGGNRV